jgi:Zn-dependent peptidase ImmA (M78 family)
MRPVSPQLAPAKEQALSLLRQHGIDAPPVSFAKILSSLWLTLIEKEFPSDMQNTSGFLDIEKSTIYINANDSFQRRMFTLAHEIGHFTLHQDILEKEPWKYELVYRSVPLEWIVDPIEQQANCFAAHLLVPKSMLDKYYHQASIDQLSAIFWVSKQVIGYRIATEY